MKVYPEELVGATLAQSPDFPRLTVDQLTTIRDKGQSYLNWYRRHAGLHNSISIIVVLALFSLDYYCLITLPHVLGASSHHFSWTAILACSFLHGFLMYSVGVYTMHEGYAHNLIIQAQGKTTILLQTIINNASRLFFADPAFYKETHIRHHLYFGTDQDGAFTNFVLPVRFFKSLLPFASVLPFNDYKIHAGVHYTRSRLLTDILSATYIIIYCFIIIPRFGWIHSLLLFVLFSPWVAFTLDRLRETFEHNLMPMDSDNGARNMGIGFWSFLIGGGPWGQPCHWSHHLAPYLPWYFQIRLHGDLKKILSDHQKKSFIMRNIKGFPLTLISVVRANIRTLRKISAE